MIDIKTLAVTLILTVSSCNGALAQATEQNFSTTIAGSMYIINYCPQERRAAQQVMNHIDEHLFKTHSTASINRIADGAAAILIEWRSHDVKTPRDFCEVLYPEVAGTAKRLNR